MAKANIEVKKELISHFNNSSSPHPVSVIDLSTSDSDSSSDAGVNVTGKRLWISSRGGEGGSVFCSKKKKKFEALGVVLPEGFLDPLPLVDSNSPLLLPNGSACKNGRAIVDDDPQSCKQFWKAGDYEGDPSGDWSISEGGMDHARVHPKFLHSNATSHKWVLGAFAELLDNSLDEVCNGATIVNIDMVKNKKGGSRMLLIEDNGGGMDPDKMRHCMSLGYSVKSKIADTIGQYGNGFKTSTMRLGADVIVFSRCCGKDGKRPTQSIGLLSYTFLTSTGKEDIVVPMLDYERGGKEWKKIMRSSAGDWNINIETMVRWSPFSSEADLLQQFNRMKDQGTRIIVYNLWEDDQGLLELDFDADPHDIQIRGVNRDEKNIQMAQQFPNSRHFLTYRHSLRSYASILYLRIPPGFRIILRGKDVERHNVVNDMMMTKEVIYRPQPGAYGVAKDSNMVAIVTIGFVKDAKSHIDVQGFNVYHKNRLIKPFWRVWHPPGSDGRGVIGLLEANFVEPAHDKQGFERTIVLSRLEAKLVQMQRTYWTTNCHKIGYAPRNIKTSMDVREMSPDYIPQTSPQSKKRGNASSNKAPVFNSTNFYSCSNKQQGRREPERRHPKTVDKGYGNGHLHSKGENRRKISGKGASSSVTSSSVEDVSDNDAQTPRPERRANGSSQLALPLKKSFGNGGLQTIRSPQHLADDEAERCSSGGRAGQITGISQSKGEDAAANESSPANSQSQTWDQLKKENCELKERLKMKDEEILGDLLRDLQNERDKCKSLETQLQEATRKIEQLNKEQESLVDIFSEERERREIEEEILRKKLKDASTTIQELLDKARLLEKLKCPN